MITIPIHTKKSYQVYISPGLLKQSGELASRHVTPCKAVIVTDSTVAPLYLETVAASFGSCGFNVTNYTFEAGEHSKNLNTLSSLLEFLARSQITRSDCLVALGGGVTGDLTGFAAAVYLRGIRYIQIPTTLPACVDSSVGGKTAVDLNAGKNLAGVFWQPELVICDTQTLSTLPQHVFSDGIAESLKYGIIRSKPLFDEITNDSFSNNCQSIIARCIEIKEKLVSEDEFDTGNRELLNYGHTVGHAIEKLSHFKVSHGHAVAIGMNIAADIAYKIGFCTLECSKIVKDSLIHLGFPLEHGFTKDELIPIILLDKKRRGDTIDFILPKEIGNCEIYPLPVSKLTSIL